MIIWTDLARHDKIRYMNIGVGMRVEKLPGYKPTTEYRHVHSAIAKALTGVSSGSFSCGAFDDEWISPSYNLLKGGYLEQSVRQINQFLNHIERLLNIKISTVAGSFVEGLTSAFNKPRADIVTKNPTVAELGRLIAEQLSVSFEDLSASHIGDHNDAKAVNLG